MRFQTTKRLACVATVLFATFGAARASFARDDELIGDAQRTVAKYRRADPGLDEFIQRSSGYAVFPGVGKGGYVVGGAHGTGVLFEHGVPTGKVTLNQVTRGRSDRGRGILGSHLLPDPGERRRLQAGQGEPVRASQRRRARQGRRGRLPGTRTASPSSRR